MANIDFHIGVRGIVDANSPEEKQFTTYLHYWEAVATCVPFDPESKGSSEATVRIAKADLVPTDANLLDDYASWGELVDACDTFTTEVNARPHRVTRRPPLKMLAEGQFRLHRWPDVGVHGVLRGDEAGVRGQRRSATAA
jgi:hypothetical protein